jgi:protein involved in polysaccharide export with SLBB domain
MTLSRRTVLALLLVLTAARPSGAALGQAREVRVFVTGHVNAPGSYLLPRSGKVSVQDVLKLAGDVTDRGDINNVTISRRVNGKSVELAAKPSDTVQANDVVQVGAKSIVDKP